MTKDPTFEPAELVIGGRRVPAHATARIPLVDPATEEVFGSIVDGDEQDVDAAVQAAQAAAADWAARTPGERADHLNRLASELEKRAEDLAQLITKQNGLPISITRASVSARSVIACPGFRI